MNSDQKRFASRFGTIFLLKLKLVFSFTAKSSDQNGRKVGSEQCGQDDAFHIWPTTFSVQQRRQKQKHVYERVLGFAYVFVQDRIIRLPCLVGPWNFPSSH